MLLKKSGLGGSNAGPLNLKASRLYLNRGLTRGRLVSGWSIDANGVFTSEDRFFLALVGLPASEAFDSSGCRVVSVVLSRGAQTVLADLSFESVAGLGRC